MRAPSAGSGRGLAFGALALGGALALAAGTRPWWRARAPDAEVAFSGAVTSGGLAPALGLVLLAGTLLAAVLRAPGRRLLAALLAAAAAAVTVVGVVRPEPGSSAVVAALRRVTLADAYELRGTPWPWLYAAAGVLALAGAVTVLRFAASWPQRADRFRRAAAVGPDADPAAVWAALDAGLDPTTTDPRDPDVRSRRARDTMGPPDSTRGLPDVTPRDPPAQ